MANTTSQIKIIFDGTAKGVVAAAAAAKSAISGLNDENDRLATFSSRAGSGLATVTKGIAALGAAGSAVQVIGGVAGAMVQLAPAALLLPGALLAGGAAMGTFKIATAGLGDALKAGLTGDMAKFAEATKDMAPAMQQAAKAAIAFKPQIDDLRKTVQGNFWGQFSGQITALGNTYLPILKTGLGDVATQMGVVAKGAIQAAQTPFFKGAITSILSSTAGFFREVGSAAGDVITGIVGIGKVGAQYLPALGTGIGGVAKRFKDWVTSFQGQNQIKVWIDGAIAGFRDLFAVVGNIGSILGSVFTGLGGQIGSPLAGLRDLTGQLAVFLKTAEAHEGLSALGSVLFTAANVIGKVLVTALREVMPFLVDVAPAAKAVAQGVGDFLVGAIQVAGPLLRGMATFLSENADSLRAVVPLLLGAAVAIKGLLVAQKVVGAVSGAAKAIQALGVAAGSASAKVGLMSGALGRAAGVVGLALVANEVDKINVAAAGGEQNLTGFAENLHDIVGAGKQLISGDFSGIIADIGDEVGQMSSTWSQGQAPVQQWASAVGSAISSAGSSVLSFATGLPGQIGSALSSLGSTIAAAAAGAWNFLVTTAQTAVTSVVTFVAGLPGQVGAALSSLGASIAAAASSAWNTLVTATQTAIGSVIAFTTDLPFKVGFALGSLAGIIASAAVSAWNALVTATTTAVTAVVAFAVALPGQVGSALASLGAAIVSVAASAWSAFTNAVRTGANAAVAFVRSVPGLVAGALSALASTLTAAASTAWNAFTSAIRTGANASVAFVRSIPGLIVGALSSLAGQLTSSATSAANGFTSGLRNGFNAAVAFVRGIPGQIAGAIGNLGGLLVNAGRSVIDGLLAGIRAGVQAMYDFVSGIAAGIAARKGPIEADRKLLIPAGVAIMQGLSAGLSTGYSDVIGRVSAMAGGIADQLSINATPSVSLAAGSLSVSAPDTTAETLRQLLSLQTDTTPIEVTVLLDGQPVRDIARTEITTSSRATRRTVGMGAGTTF